MPLCRCRHRYAISLLALAALLPITAHAQKPDTFVQTQVPARKQPEVALAGIRIKPGSIVGGQSAFGWVTLNTVATADLVVALKSTDPHLTVPDTVTVPAGGRTRRFEIQTTRVQALTKLTVNATYLKTAAIPVLLKPVILMSATFKPKQVKGGSSTALTLKLSGAAPPGGVTIALIISDPDRLPGPHEFTISEGRTYGVVSILTSRVKANEKITVKASENGVTVVGNLLLTPDFTEN